MTVRRLLVFLVTLLSAARAASAASVPPATYHADSLWVRGVIDTLCYHVPAHPANDDPANWRTRFTFRPEAQGEAVPFLQRRLEALGASVALEGFPCTWATGGTELTTTGVNVVGRFATRSASFGQDSLLDGRRPVVVLGGHWDSSGLREGAAWTDHWQTLNAAGADDNASGMAATLLAARNLAHASFPFDLMVAFFDAEELPGLQGSRAFVRERRAAGDTVLLYIDLDTIGYNPDYLRTEILHNGESLWLARACAAENAASWPALDEIAILAQPGLANSDHFSFWEAGIQAVTFAEHYLPEQPFTHWRGTNVYDTRRDTADSLRYDLITTIGYTVERVLRSIGGQFTGAPALPSWSITPGDLDVRWERSSAGAPPNAGQTLGLTLTAHASGFGPANDPLRWTLEDRTAAGTTRLAAGDTTVRAHTLGILRVPVQWASSPTDVGSHQLSFTLWRQPAPDADAQIVASASTVVVLYGPGLTITGIGSVPSPARTGQPFDVHYYLPDAAPVTLTVADVRGRVVERQEIPASIGGSPGARAGDNRARVTADLAPGVYFVHLTASRRDGRDASASGRIVVVR